MPKENPNLYGEKESSKAVQRTQIREFLEETDVLPAHTIRLPFLSLKEGEPARKIEQAFILPPITSPQMQIVGELCTDLVRTIDQISLQNLVSSIHNNEDQEEAFDRIASSFHRIRCEAIGQTTRLPQLLEGVTDYYSQINGIQPPTGIVIKPFATSEQYEEEVGYYSDKEYLDREETVSNPDYRKIFGFADRIYRIDEDPKNDHDPFVDLAVHEWLHHNLHVLEVDHGISDLSDFVDVGHTENFIKLAKHVGIAEPLIGDTSLNNTLNAIQREKRQILGID
jgi:hypothetical protein